MRLANTRVALHVLGALDDHCRSFDGFERLAVGVVLARPLRVDDDPLGSSVAVPLQIIEERVAVVGIYNRSHMYTVRVSARLRCELPERRHVCLESGQARHKRIPAIIRPDHPFQQLSHLGQHAIERHRAPSLTLHVGAAGLQFHHHGRAGEPARKRAIRPRHVPSPSHTTLLPRCEHML